MKEPLKVIAGAPDRPLMIGDIELPCYVLEDATRDHQGDGSRVLAASPVQDRVHQCGPAPETMSSGRHHPAGCIVRSWAVARWAASFYRRECRWRPNPPICDAEVAQCFVDKGLLLAPK